MGLTGFNRARREAAAERERAEVADQPDSDTAKNGPSVESDDVRGGAAETDIKQPATENTGEADTEAEEVTDGADTEAEAAPPPAKPATRRKRKADPK